MCNLLRFEMPLHELMEEFSQLRIPVSFDSGAPNLPAGDIRPTDPAAVVVGSPSGAILRQLRWGFAPPGKGGPVINFRSEGRRVTSGRCLVPIDGFYEFTGAKAPKSKWLFTAADDAIGTKLFCLAGLMRDDRFTVLTREPGPDVAPYHDRQIVILPRAQWRNWLESPDSPPIPELPAGSLAVQQLR